MALHVIGINHQSAPLELREQVAFDPTQLTNALDSVGSVEHVDEALILSTCNRTEIYFHGEQAQTDSLDAWIHQSVNRSTEVWPHLYRKSEAEVIQHICRVAVGLDSLILGEPQILGQLKVAFRLAQENGTLGPHLYRLLNNAFSTAKRIRSETAIGESATSAASAAIQLAHQVYGDLHDKRALMIGAGEMIEIAAAHLNSKDIGGMTIVNRSIVRAQKLANKLNCQARPFDTLDKELSRADLVFSCTASPDYIVMADAVAAALAKRKQRPLFIVDLAVPRDVDPKTAKLNDVFLYTVDDLHQAVDENLESRRQAATDAEEIIQQHTDRFLRRHEGLSAVPVIRKLRDRSNSIKDDLVQQALKQVDAGRSTEEALQWLADSLTNKIMHHPSHELRRGSENSDKHLLEAAVKLFGLDDDTGSP